MSKVRIVISLLLISHCLPNLAESEVKVTAGMELGYDDNIIVEELDLQSSLGDQFLNYSLKGDFEYTINKKHEFSASFGLNDRQFQDAEAFDLFTTLTTVGYSYELNDLTLGVDVRTADSELGGINFLQLDQVSPYFSYFINRENFIRGSYTASDKTLDNNPTRNAEADEFGLDYYHFINGLNRYVIISGKMRDQKARDTLFDYESSQFRIAYKQRVAMGEQTLKLSFAYRYKQRDYNTTTNPQIGDTRLDEIYSLEAKASIELIDQLEVYVDIRFRDSNSNLPDYTFTDSRYTLGLSYEF